MKMTYYQVFRKAAERIAKGEDKYSCIAVERVTHDYKRAARRYYEKFFRDCGRHEYYPFLQTLEGEEDDFASEMTPADEREMRVLLLLLVAEEVRGKRLYEEVD